MSGAVTLIEDLDREGIELWMDGDELRIRGPAGSVADHYLAAIQAEKTSIIEILRAREPRRGSALPGVADGESIWTPTLSHRSIATSAQMRPISMLFWWNGALDTEALQRALDKIGQRHDALRTRYAVDERGRFAP